MILRYLLDTTILSSPVVKIPNSEIMKRLDEAGIPVLSPREEKHRSGIVVAKAENGKEIARMMFERHNAYVSARGGGIRFAPHIYNSLEDCDRVVAAFLDCLKNPKSASKRKGAGKCGSI